MAFRKKANPENNISDAQGQTSNDISEDTVNQETATSQYVYMSEWDAMVPVYTAKRI